MFVAHSVSISLIRALRPVVAVIAQHDRSLADQIQRASARIALGLGEGSCSSRGNRRLRFEEALGSAKEVRSALLVADALGYVAEGQLSAVEAILDRQIALIWGLTHPKRAG